MSKPKTLHFGKEHKEELEKILGEKLPELNNDKKMKCYKCKKKQRIELGNFPIFSISFKNINLKNMKKFFKGDTSTLIISFIALISTSLIILIIIDIKTLLFYLIGIFVGITAFRSY